MADVPEEYQSLPTLTLPLSLPKHDPSAVQATGHQWYIQSVLIKCDMLSGNGSEVITSSDNHV